MSGGLTIFRKKLVGTLIRDLRVQIINLFTSQIYLFVVKVRNSLHSCQVLENRMLENKDCCAVALRNCEGAYCDVPEKCFHNKRQASFNKRNLSLVQHEKAATFLDILKSFFRPTLVRV